jgi:hypothetical protein
LCGWIEAIFLHPHPRKLEQKKKKKKRIENSKMVQELTTRPKILADPNFL